jgi:hypothetical protein
MYHVYNFNCQEAVGIWVMHAHHAKRHKPIVVYDAFFASYYPYVYVRGYERIPSENLSQEILARLYSFLPSSPSPLTIVALAPRLH